MGKEVWELRKKGEGGEADESVRGCDCPSLSPLGLWPHVANGHTSVLTPACLVLVGRPPTHLS